MSGDELTNAVTSGLVSVSSELDSGLGSVSTKLGSVSTELDSGLGSISTKLDNGLGSISTKLDSGLRGLKIKIVEEIKNYQSDPDSQIVKDLEFQIEGLTQSLKSQKTTIESIKEDLDEAIQAQNSVRLLVGTEEKLKEKGFLKTKQILVWKSYRLIKELSADTSLVKIAPTRKSFSLESAPRKLVDGPGPLKLKELVYHSGKLKKYAYNVLS